MDFLKCNFYFEAEGVEIKVHEASKLHLLYGSTYFSFLSHQQVSATVPLNKSLLEVVVTSLAPFN